RAARRESSRRNARAERASRARGGHLRVVGLATRESSVRVRADRRGRGRARDNSSVASPDEIERVIRIARENRIPLQYGVTNGGNDGSEFARFGAIDAAVAWPLRYSHSPAEVMDLRDLRSLTRLVAALAKAPTNETVRPPRRP